MRRLTLILLVILVVFPSLSRAQVDFDRYFTKGSLRVDLFHTGVAGEEVYAIDEIIREPFWGGNPRALIDTLNLGGHLLRVYDLNTNRLIFSRGYCSLFGEWVTVDEALEGIARTFHESLIMPFPQAAVQIKIDHRDRENIFRTTFDFIVDPADFHITTESRYSGFKIRKLQDKGDPARKVDIVILGDGYQKSELHKLRDDVKRFLDIFFGVEPFKSRRDDFNVRLVESWSAESKVDNPRQGIYRNNLLGLSFNSLELDRYMLSPSNKVIRDVAAKVPYDQIILLANEEKYGGGGIFNLYSTCVSDNEFDGYIFVHEFGHAFAGLADEYYSSNVSYNDMYPQGIEPWEPNITALLNPGKVKWGHLIKAGTPVPTPDDSTFAGVTGCFEGAGYSAKGLYRSQRDCIMKSKILTGFCPACRAAIERMIDFQTR
ncbi:MAG: peptidase M64 [Candidatus Krumholzibacteriota bacterium]|nr:peptidase M64 [Candidatus Krumholzibacteriota bacterium]